MRREPLLSKRLELDLAAERAFRPPPSSNRPLLVVVVALALALCLALSQGWLNFQRGEPARSTKPVGEAIDRTAVSLPQLDGQPGASIPAEGPRADRITKCISPAGVATYLHGVCPAGTRTTSVAVQRDSNLADGMSPSAREESQRANRAWAQAQADHERRVAMNTSVGGTSTECAQLDAYIRALDDAARQPLQAAQQDRIRGDRKAARDRQFALRCQ